MKRSAILICLLVSSTASAHFKLNAPASRSQQDGLGGPQKSAPCGLSDDSATADDSTPTNIVTPLMTGSMITVSINETIFHPGHYRVAIAQDIAGLPADPPVTAGGSPSTACGSTIITASPTMPLLADGELLHTSSFGAATTKTFQVQLPPGFTCTNCVLQVVQFMSNHVLNNPGGCFYHHCSVVTISDDAPAQPDAGATSGDDAGTPGDDDGVSGGCCSTSNRVPSFELFAA
ncbi:MAG: SCE4755 family polysaccharide monooxygenase-like protein, partial [Kofleriaceae bacterium]